MKPMRYEALETSEWLLRYGVPVLAWAAVITFFAFSGSSSGDVQTQVVAGAPALAPMPDGPAAVRSVPGAREPKPVPRDGAVVAHEVRGAVGAGRNPTP